MRFLYGEGSKLHTTLTVTSLASTRGEMRAKTRFRVYRALAGRGRRMGRGPMLDADIVILLALLAPAFFGVFVWAVFYTQDIGAGPTVCGALAVLGVAMAMSAWRARGSGPTEPFQ